MPNLVRNPSAGRIIWTVKSLLGPIAFALLTLLMQVVLRRELAPGEFGTMNALLGLVLVLLVPFAMLSAVLRRDLVASKRADWHSPLLNRAALAWGLVCAFFLFISLPSLQLPRTSLQFFTLPAVAAGLLAICGGPAAPVRWSLIIAITGAILRLLVSAWAAADWPTAESGLGALVLAGLVVGLPALRDQPSPDPLASAWKRLPFHVPALAAIAMAFALALFTNADRIAAQLVLGTADPARIASPDATGAPLVFVDYRLFDDYQAAGLVARGLLWALLPLLGLFYFQRAPLARTTYGSLRWLWIYLGALLLGALFLMAGAPVANALFNPFFLQHATAPREVMLGHLDLLLPSFAGAFFVLGLVQAMAVFALASKRHVECFVLAACSLGYTAFVLNVGPHPALLTGLMAGGALMSLALVLLVGVVRYARSHP